MTATNFLYLILGMGIGFIPTAIRVINRKLESLDKNDPVNDAIMQEAIRKLSDKKPVMNQNETVVPMTDSTDDSKV